MMTFPGRFSFLPALALAGSLGVWVPTPVAAQEAPVCAVASVDALVSVLEQNERHILLTRYADAVEGLRALQRDMVCMPEPPEARLLARLFVDLGYALHRMGLVSDGEKAFEVAAGIDPGVTWNTTFAASYGVKFYETAQKVRTGPTVDLRVAGASGMSGWYIDGRLQEGSAGIANIHPGWHFVQLGGASGWVGDWYNLQGEVSLDLIGLMRRLDPNATAVAASVPVDTPSSGGGAPGAGGEMPAPTSAGSGRTMLATGVSGVAVGAALLASSMVTAGRSDDAYDAAVAVQQGHGSQAEIDAVYDLEYVPMVRKTNGLRVAGFALVGVGAALGVAGLVVGPDGVALGAPPEDGWRLVLLPSGVGLSGAF